MNIFWFSFSISLQNIRKKGTSWILSNISPKKRVHRYLQNTIFNFTLKFHLEVGLVEQRYFELFFSAWSIFSSYKRSLLNEAVFTLFYICFNFGHICCTAFSVESLGLWDIKKSSKYELVIFLDEKPRFTFANFLQLFIQGPPLTHSAMILGEQLRIRSIKLIKEKR